MITDIDIRLLELLRPTWAQALRMAYTTAAQSEETTQIGAVILGYDDYPIARGFNKRTTHGGRGTGLPEYFEITHGEAAAIQKQYTESPMVLVSNLACCRNCAQKIIDSGISVVVTHEDAIEEYIYRAGFDKWDIRNSHAYLYTRGVDVIRVTGKLGATRILLRGQTWCG